MSKDQWRSTPAPQTTKKMTFSSVQFKMSSIGKKENDVQFSSVQDGIHREERKQCSVQFKMASTEKKENDVQFCSVQDGIYALGKPHMCCTLSLRRFPNTVNSSNVHLIDDGPLSSFQGRSSSNFSFLQVIDGVMSLALCPQVVLEASQHFRSSEKNKENDIRWNIVFHHNQGLSLIHISEPTRRA